MLIGTKEGVTRCYAIKRMTEEDRWNAAEVAELQGTPQQPNPMKVGLHIPTRLPADVALGGGADGAAAEGDGEATADIPADSAPMPDPLVRQTPITYKEIENTATHQDAEDVHPKPEEKLQEGDIRTYVVGESRR